jgi:hypothetical protein
MGYTREQERIEKIAEYNQLNQLIWFEVTKVEDVLDVAKDKDIPVRNRSGTSMDIDFDKMIENGAAVLVRGYVDGRKINDQEEWGSIVVSDIILALTSSPTQCADALKEFANINVGEGFIQWQAETPPSIEAHFD